MGSAERDRSRLDILQIYTCRRHVTAAYILFRRHCGVANCQRVGKSVQTAELTLPPSSTRTARPVKATFLARATSLKPGPPGPRCSERSAARLAHQSGGLGVAS